MLLVYKKGHQVRKQSFFIGSMTLVLAAGVAFQSPATALAQGERGGKPQNIEAKRTDAQKRAKQEREARHAAAKEKSTAAKTAACEKRKAGIEARTAKVQLRAERQIAVFDKIAARVKAFAEEHDRKPANYEELVAAVETARAAAVEGAAEMEVTQAIDCAVNPKGDITAFKASLKKEIAALKAYKTSIKNLIVGVKSVQGQESKLKNKTTDGSDTETDKTTEETGDSSTTETGGTDASGGQE